jgi:putative CocE/NonD family hydrolase
LVTTLESYPYLTTLLQHGYIVAAVDVRGTGASFGVYQGGTDMTEAHDLYDMTEWLAAQPWCSGNVGMYGASYRGNNQYWAAMTAPPGLKCIFPEVAPFDGYFSGRPNGVFWDRYLKDWGGYTQALDLDLGEYRGRSLGRTAPVDGDAGNVMLNEAVAQHKDNISTYDVAQAMLYRNGWNPATNQAVSASCGDTYLDLVQASGIPAYHWTGWFDYFVYNQPAWFVNLEQPQKMTIGPWVHGDRGQQSELAAVEHLRWYDCWLKGIDNGIMEEPPVYYYTMGEVEGKEWGSAWDWPITGMDSAEYYFAAGASGSVSSLNDGTLSAVAPGSAAGQDVYQVEDFTLDLKDRWSAGTMADIDTDRTPLDSLSLTYTTAPLATDTRLTGSPVVHLWASCSAADADFFVYLEEVDGAGRSVNASDGLLRASHRALNAPPWDAMGLPWHRSYSGDVSPLPVGEPVELVFALAPTSNIFDSGHRIRVTVTCTDYADIFDTPRGPGVEVTLYRNKAYASYITLPIGQVA